MVKVIKKITRKQARRMLRAGEREALTRGFQDLWTWDAVRLDPNNDSCRVLGIAKDWEKYRGDPTA